MTRVIMGKTSSGEKVGAKYVINKILFLVFLGAISLGILWLTYGAIPDTIAIWTGAIIAVLYGLYSALRQWDPIAAEQFEFWWKKFARIIIEIIKNLKKSE